MRILCFGSMNMDYTYHVDHLVRPGETLTPLWESNCPGGKGLNQAIALAKAGAQVAMAGCLGKEDGDFLYEVYKKNGIDCSHVSAVPGLTGRALIQVDRSSQNCIILSPAANRKITTEQVDQVISAFAPGDFLLLQNEINCMDYIITRAHAQGMVIALNPSPFDQEMMKCNLALVQYLILNEIEGEQITGKKEPEDILASLKEMYPETKVVLTLGSQGSRYQDKEQSLTQGIYPVKAVDTTAAGDTFTGFFLASLLQGKSVREGLDLAAKASALAVTKPGATDSIPTLEDVVAFRV